jgi:hypothetical protein
VAQRSSRAPHRGGDLFEIFPDLPWYRRRNSAEQLERVRRQVRLTQVRANENIRRQREATDRMRVAIAGQVLQRQRRLK